MIELEYQTSVYIPIATGCCKEVYLCLDSSFEGKTTSGVPFVRATIQNSGRALGIGAYPRFSNPRCTLDYQYSLQVDETQLLTDPETELPYELTCEDIVEIFPYACFASNVVLGGGGEGGEGGVATVQISKEGCELSIAVNGGVPGTIALSEIKDILSTSSVCGRIISLVDCNDEILTPTFNIGMRSLQTQADHGFGPTGDLVAVRYDTPLARWVLAQADVFPHAAHFMAVIVDANSFELLDTGFHVVVGHGLTEIARWYSVHKTTPGELSLTADAVAPGIIQNAVFPISASCVYVDVGEPIANCYECTIMTQVDHGFVLPAYGVLPIYWDGDSWAPAIATGIATAAQLYVVQIIDDDTFQVANPGTLYLPGHGLTIGLDYYLSPDVAGTLVPLADIVDECEQKVLTVMSENCLMLQPCCMACPVV